MRMGASGDIEDVVRCALRAAREARCKACFELLPKARWGGTARGPQRRRLRVQSLPACSPPPHIHGAAPPRYLTDPRQPHPAAPSHLPPSKTTSTRRTHRAASPSRRHQTELGRSSGLHACLSGPPDLSLIRPRWTASARRRRSPRQRGCAELGRSVGRSEVRTHFFAWALSARVPAARLLAASRYVPRYALRACGLVRRAGQPLAASAASR